MVEVGLQGLVPKEIHYEVPHILSEVPHVLLQRRLHLRQESNFRV